MKIAVNIYGNIVVLITFTENSFFSIDWCLLFGLQVSKKYYIFRTQRDKILQFDWSVT